jgi:hypothetical protein
MPASGGRSAEMGQHVAARTLTTETYDSDSRQTHSPPHFVKMGRWRGVVRSTNGAARAVRDGGVTCCRQSIPCRR